LCTIEFQLAMTPGPAHVIERLKLFKAILPKKSTIRQKN